MFLMLIKTLETKYDQYKCCTSQGKAFQGPSGLKVPELRTLAEN